MNRIISWGVALIFILFAILNLNDPDGWIWAFVYLAVAIIPFVRNVRQKFLNQLASILLVIGLLLVSGLLNNWMPKQADDRMVNLWEHQREGLGIILGSVWLLIVQKLK